MPKSTTPKLNDLQKAFLDRAIDVDRRVESFVKLVRFEPDEARPVLRALFQRGDSVTDAELMGKKLKEVEQRLAELHAGPSRTGTFLRTFRVEGEAHARAAVSLPEGVTVCPFITSDDLELSLARGATVMLDAAAAKLLAVLDPETAAGELCKLVAIGRDRQVEVSLQNDTRHTMPCGDKLWARIAAGQVGVGDRLVANPAKTVALDAVKDDGESAAGSPFLDRSPVPSISLQDVAAPSPMIFDVIDAVRQEQSPATAALRRRFRLSRSQFKLAIGAPGTGKSHSIAALIRGVMEETAAHVGVPLEALPPRVLRLNAANCLSHWLGQSEKLLMSFFDTAVALYDQPFRAHGRDYHLPVIAVLEECDAIAARHSAAGEMADSAMPRILSSLLERFDPARAEYQDRLLIFVGTTNRDNLAPGFVRRLGEDIYRFDRIAERTVFMQVLETHLRNLPLAAQNGTPQDALRRCVAERLGAWLFGAHADTPLVEIVPAGATTPLKKWRRDFLTPALIQRSIRRAASLVCAAEGLVEPALSTALLAEAIEEQLAGIVGLLSPENVREHCDLPDSAVRIASLRRVPPSPLPPFEDAAHTPTQDEP